jgi:hypothetical protein
VVAVAGPEDLGVDSPRGAEMVWSSINGGTSR